MLGGTAKCQWMSTYFVIFGAAVTPDGAPSGTLARRIEGALAAAAGGAHARFMPTGGVGAHGIVEADVIARVLTEAGVPASAIVLERRARDTLESVIYCDALLRAAGDADCVEPCTSHYHLPRCALLLRMLGWRVRIPSMPGDLGSLPLGKLLAYWSKEVVALPYDAALLFARQRSHTA
jgi:uncharacterized SAM-binding protein YcdF (DUF218 family)